MKRPLAATATLLLPSLAWAGPSMGVGALVGVDLPDPASGDSTVLGPGPGLHIPVWFGDGLARLRVTGRSEVAFGQDRITWAEDVNGAPQRFGSADHFTMVALAGLTAGPELVLAPDAAIRPNLGAEFGGAWVGTYHSLDASTAFLMDPALNDLENANNVDPYTNQWALMTDLHAGLTTGDAVGLWTEVGYSASFVAESTLRKTLAEYEARRSAFGWNAVRLTLGVRFAL